MRRRRPPVQIPTPCPKLWSELDGDAQARFCQHCQKTVHNLSHMSRSERTAILTDPRGACVAYETDPKGQFVSHTGLVGGLRRLRVTLMALVAVVAPFAFSSCTSTTLGKPCPPEPQSDNKRVKEVESDGKVMVTVGEIIVEERPLWKRILWPF